MRRNKKHPQKNQSFGEVRIIGGDFRGRKLPVLSGDGLRPTSDRVKETLFNWLQFDIAGARCLDAFSGSGALGLEALSRGASFVTFLEKSPQVAEQLKQNLKTLKIDNAEVICTDSLAFLQKQPIQAYDGIFLDPPFGKEMMQTALSHIFEKKWLKNTPSPSAEQDDMAAPQGGGGVSDVFLYLEQEKKLDWPELPDFMQLHKDKTTSQVRYGLWFVD